MAERAKYFSMATTDTEATIDIYGDITSWADDSWFGDEKDWSAYKLSNALNELSADVKTIRVNVNSYGGEVAEGLAIHNALVNHPAKVITRCDGFACSIASVIFMAGDERVMNDASLLMIHNAWTWANGNASELRKQADDLDVITSASKAAYMRHVNITMEELTDLMDAESWIAPTDAVRMGFATAIEDGSSIKPNQSVKRHVMEILSGISASHRASVKASKEVEPEPEPEPEPKPEPVEDHEGDACAAECGEAVEQSANEGLKALAAFFNSNF